MERMPSEAISEAGSIAFGTVEFSAHERDFFGRLNGQVMKLCRSLPRSMQAGALQFLMDYTRTRVGEPLEFYRDYFPPSWSVLFHLYAMQAPGRAIGRTEKESILTFHAMAMFLHSLDDHLNDGDIPASHLSLLLRSQAWVLMMESLRFLAKDDREKALAEDLVDLYFRSVTASGVPGTLDEYCGAFRGQMGTWLVAPVLLARKVLMKEAAVNALRSAYESFGIAWRLLDDVNDLAEDMERGARTAVYLLLPEEGRKLWDDLQGRSSSSQARVSAREDLLRLVLERRVLHEAACRISGELEGAASLACSCGLAGLAAEFRALGSPLRMRSGGCPDDPGKENGP